MLQCCVLTCGPSVTAFFAPPRRQRRGKGPARPPKDRPCTQRKCMRVGVQREQTLLVTTELVIWRCVNAFFFTSPSEVDFGVAFVYTIRRSPYVPQLSRVLL
jgi:hypothetical protein